MTKTQVGITDEHRSARDQRLFALRGDRASLAQHDRTRRSCRCDGTSIRFRPRLETDQPPMSGFPCTVWKYCDRAAKLPTLDVPSRTPVGSSRTRTSSGAAATRWSSAAPRPMKCRGSRQQLGRAAMRRRFPCPEPVPRVGAAETTPTPPRRVPATAGVHDDGEARGGSREAEHWNKAKDGPRSRDVRC